jgi:hypothetical protein
MFAATRRHITYANVAATLALVFSMSGGALAAKHYLIDSTKQISPNVLRKLRGTRGARGSAGPRGTEGQPGKVGATGLEGQPGKEGAPGATHVVTRYGPKIALPNGIGNVSYAACLGGEAVTGGGFDFPELEPVDTSYGLIDRPSVVVEPRFGEPTGYPPPANGTSATGWVVMMENSTGATFNFQAYVQCASR